jgi:cytoskeleton protein RodZ
VAFGVNLKRERELREITLEEIAKATKISVRLLKAIESDRFDIFPESVFRKSFIKSYARYLGMNEEKVLQEYALQFQTGPASSTQVEKPARIRATMGAASSRRSWLGIGIAILVLAGCGAYWYFKNDTSSKSVEPAPAPTATDGTSTGPPNPASTQGSGTTTTQTPPSSLKVLGELAKKPKPSRATPPGSAGLTPGTLPELTVQATEEAWLSVHSGEKPLFSGLLNSQESRSFPLQSPLKLVLGNAGGVRILVNGQPFSSLGRAGERKTLEISSENYKQYLAPEPQ